MLLWPLRWLLRQVGGVLIGLLLAGGAFLWSLRWVPFPPVAVLVGFFSGDSPTWSWLSAEGQTTLLREAVKWADEQPSRRPSPPLAQRTAEQMFYPRGASPWGSAVLGGLLSVLWGEERLLTFYLNAIPYDAGIYGVKAASEKRFGKLPAQLTPEEVAELVVRRKWPYLERSLPAALMPEYRRLCRHLSRTALTHAPQAED